MRIPSQRQYRYKKKRLASKGKALVFLVVFGVGLLAKYVLTSPSPYMQGYNYAEKRLRTYPGHDEISILRDASDGDEIPRIQKGQEFEYLSGVRDAVARKPAQKR